MRGFPMGYVFLRKASVHENILRFKEPTEDQNRRLGLPILAVWGRN
jgi:hypothetical protein